MPKAVPSSATNPAKTLKTKGVKSKTYAGFLPLPLLLPSPVPIPSSSSSTSKATKQAKHYIYCREHKSKAPPSKKGKSSAGGSSDDLPSGRTLFVTNLPADVTERDLRTVFGEWGVVQDVRISRKETGDVLEGVVRGLSAEEINEEDDESEASGDEEEEHDEEEEEEKDERENATFKGDLLTKKQRRAIRRRDALLESIPPVSPLSPLNPRSLPFGQSGLAAGYIVFLDEVSLSRLLESGGKEIQVAKYSQEPTGLSYYDQLYTSLRPSLDSVREFANTSMAHFDHLSSLLLSSRARAQGAGALVDADGFTVVVRSGKYGRAGARGEGWGQGKGGVGVATRGFEKKKGKKGVGASALPDFYKFQATDRKRQDLADLRQKFEHDKARVEELKKSRRYKPY
ncbi:hypothetical protein IAR50_001566 [Cryptococcus sp. DSM 104548]